MAEQHSKAGTETISSSPVEKILSSLTELEKDIDGVKGSIEDIRRRLSAYSDEEIEKLKEKLTSLANEEAKRIIEQAKKEAEEETARITAEGESSLGTIKKNIDGSFDRAVDLIVEKILAA
ncbi:MAG: hypothetical protein ACE5JV_00815 [Nitrososphaerales archaeon]